MRTSVLMVVIVAGSAVAACGASRHGTGPGAGTGGNAACTLSGAWTITISNANDPCGLAEPGRAATLKFHTNADGVVSGATPPLAGFSMSASPADCRYTLHADKSQGAPEWAEFSLQIHPGGQVSGEGHTDVAMSDGRVCTVPHSVTGTKE